jgi:L-serine dehydratase
MKESTHVNAMKFVLTGQSGKVITLVGDSTGGGMVRTVLVNGYPLQVQGDCYVVLLYDAQQALSAGKVVEWASRQPGYLESGVSSVEDRGRLHFIKTGEAPDLVAIQSAFPGLPVDLLKPVLPVLARPDRRPQLFTSMTEWRRLASERGLPLWEVAIQYETDASGWTRDQVIDAMRSIAGKMHHQIHAAYDDGMSIPESPFKANLAAMWPGASRRRTGWSTA